MAEIDLEQIRKEAVEEYKRGIKKTPYGDMIRVYADIASEVTKLMMEKYRQQQPFGDL